MSVHYNGQNIKEMYYNGQKISEAYYNGEKVFSGENVLFEDDVYFAKNQILYTLPEVYPVGSTVIWEPVAPYNFYGKTLSRISGGSTQESQYLQSVDTQTEFVSSIAFNTLGYMNPMGTTEAKTFHVKIIAGA